MYEGLCKVCFKYTITLIPKVFFSSSSFFSTGILAHALVLPHMVARFFFIYYTKTGEYELPNGHKIYQTAVI
jgi:hypothetical protein